MLTSTFKIWNPNLYSNLSLLLSYMNHPILFTSIFGICYFIMSFLPREWPVLYSPALGHKANFRGGLGTCRHQRPFCSSDLLRTGLSWFSLYRWYSALPLCNVTHINGNGWVCSSFHNTISVNNDQICLLQLRHSNIKSIQLKTSLLAFSPLKTWKCSR